MPCRTFPIGDGVAIVCSRGRRQSCSVAGCGRPSVALCDFDLKGRLAGKTCDKRLCEAHRVKKGPDRDFCPAHEAVALGAAGEPSHG